MYHFVAIDINRMGNKRLAVFDFDNTITTRDTFLDFLRYYSGSLRYIVGILCSSPILMLYLLKVIPNWRGKEHLISEFLKGTSLRDLEEVGNRYATTRLPWIIDHRAAARIRFHREHNDTLVLLSASPEHWYKTWCEQNGFHRIICTTLEIVDEKLTGRIQGANCHGKEKVKRLMDECDLSQFDYIYAYGDSRADLDVLSLADEAYLRFKRIK